MSKTEARVSARLILETDRLRVRELTRGDAAFILELVNDPDWLQHIGDRGVRNLRDATEFIAEGPLASYGSYGYGLWLVELKASGSAIGLCGVLKRKNLKHPDLGYALLPGYRGMGYALEACRGALSYAAKTLGIRELMAIVSPGNEKSIALLTAIAFQQAGKVRMPGQDQEVLLYQRSLELQ